jgi:superfamily II DNA or RNA helicase
MHLNCIATITLYSHFFKITNPTYEIKKLIHAFIKPLVLFERIKPVGESARFMPTKVFSCRTADEKEYRLHINQLKDFLDFLKNSHVNMSLISIEKEPLYIPEKLHYPVNIQKSPRDYQIPVIEHITHPKSSYPATLVGLPTGTGKTFCGLYSSYLIGTRLAIVILPIYINKWVEDIQTNLGVDPKSILVVRGAHEVAGVIEMAKTGTLTHDYIIISIVTMRLYIESYDEDRQDCLDQYGCAPYDFYKLLKIGQVLIDETHQHLHAIFKIMLCMHVPYLTSLTATLMTEQNVIKKVHEIMYPKSTRYDKLLMEKYIDVFAIDYAYKDFKYRRIRTEDFGSNTYSHSAYEKSIMRDSRNLNNYLDMIGYFITNSYIKNRGPQDKAIIYVATKKFGALMVDYLNEKYPYLEIRRYMEEDPLSNISEADIIVSTLISAGTAIDIPNLTHVFNTVNVSSAVANAQSLGRLRKIEGKDLSFYYFYCTDIPKQIANHNVRRTVFADRVKTLKELQYPRLL